MSNKQTIVICSSGDFYKHVNVVAAQLQTMGYNPIVPATATSMQETGNYDIAAVKTWYKNPGDYHIKAQKMRGHFKEVAKGDAILVVNDEKRGVKGYIGPNGLIEMGLAFYLNKPIYILNAVEDNSSYYEEVMGMDSIILHGDLTKIK